MRTATVRRAPAGAVVLLAGLMSAPLPAAAQSGFQAQQSGGKAVDSIACRRQCNAASPDRAMNPPATQACLLRCSAGERHLQRQNQRGTPEATGRGSAAPAAGAGLAAGVPSIWPPRQAEAGSMPPGRALVAYAGQPPGRGLAISAPIERMAAHRGAETECFRLNNNSACRLLVETRDRCLAISMGIRSNGLVVTSDPRTYTITYFGSGAGGDQATAEAAAIRDCQGRPTPGQSCRIAAVRCAN